MITNEKEFEKKISQEIIPTLSPLQCIIIDILKQDSMTRKDLVKELKTPRTTIYDNLNILEKKNIVQKSTRNTGQVGRPKILWSLKSGNSGRLLLPGPKP